MKEQNQVIVVQTHAYPIRKKYFFNQSNSLEGLSFTYKDIHKHQTQTFIKRQKHLTLTHTHTDTHTHTQTDIPES